MKNLGSLGISFVESDEVSGFPTDLPDVFGAYEWPKLKQLIIDHVQARPAELLNLVQRQQHTLTALHINTMRLKGGFGGWRHMVKQPEAAIDLYEADICGELILVNAPDYVDIVECYRMEPRYHGLGDPKSQYLRHRLGQNLTIVTEYCLLGKYNQAPEYWDSPDDATLEEINAIRAPEDIIDDESEDEVTALNYYWE